MSDDLFEFLAAQKAGRATQEAERAAERSPAFSAEVRQSSTRSKGSAALADSGSPGMPTGRVQLGSRRLYHTARPNVAL
jgi:hypothetical protein